MKGFRQRAVAVLATVAVLALTSCAVNEASGSGSDSGLSGTVTGAGASSMATAQEAWVAEFQTEHPGVTVNYSPDGSGAGREAFAGGGADFAGSDRAMRPAEMNAEALRNSRCDPSQGAMNLPVYISAIAVIYRVQGVTDLKLDAETLAAIFAGKITKWNHPKIIALNDGADLPSQNITAVHRADDSGTTENFTDYLHQAAPKTWTADPDGTWPFPRGEAAAQTSGVVDAVRNGTGTIGYADASQAGDLAVAQIKVGDAFVSYSPEAAGAVVEASKRVTDDGLPANDWTIELDRTAEGDVYPIVLLSYAIACQKYADAATAELVSSYLSYVASADGQQAAAQTAGMAPLPGKLSSEVVAAAATIS